MPTDCPGRPLTEEEQDAIAADTLDYRRNAGGWVKGQGPTSYRLSMAYYNGDQS